MPTCLRSSVFGPRLAFGSPRTPGPYSCPSTRTDPDCGSSSMLMVRSRVDLPEPDGPKITTCSPVWTLRSMPRSTSLRPKALLILRSSTAGVARRRHGRDCEIGCRLVERAGAGRVGHDLSVAPSDAAPRSVRSAQAAIRSTAPRMVSSLLARERRGVVGGDGAEGRAGGDRHAVLHQVEGGGPAVHARRERQHLVEGTARAHHVEAGLREERHHEVAAVFVGGSHLGHTVLRTGRARRGPRTGSPRRCRR